MTEDNPEECGERIVRCPVQGCDAEHPSRGIHLHLMRSVGEGHGEQGNYPDVEIDDLDEVGREAIDVDYPEERRSESVARLCPYCHQHFSGKKGVFIHLSLVEGRKDHPANASEIHKPTDFPVVELDAEENITSIMSIPRLGGDPEYKEKSGEGVREQDMELTARFTQHEILYLYEALSETGTGDERLRQILLRGFLKTLDPDT